jgi:plastocyanin
VYLSDFKFEPADIEVSVGTRVVWVNNDPTTHTVNSDTKQFNMSLPEGEVASYVFNKTGRYAYHCAIHTSMRGSVTVR